MIYQKSSTGWRRGNLSRAWQDKIRPPEPSGADGLFRKPSDFIRNASAKFSAPAMPGGDPFFTPSRGEEFLYPCPSPQPSGLPDLDQPFKLIDKKWLATQQLQRG
jgi:hypothetical protein